MSKNGNRGRKPEKENIELPMKEKGRSTVDQHQNGALLAHQNLPDVVEVVNQGRLKNLTQQILSKRLKSK